MAIAFILYSDIFSENISHKVKAAWHFLQQYFLSLSKYQDLVSVQRKFCGCEKGELKHFRLSEITITEQNSLISYASLPLFAQN